MTDTDAASRVQRATAVAFPTVTEAPAAEAPKTDVPAAEAPKTAVAAEPPKPSEQETTLAQLIRQQRGVHAQRQREAQERKDLAARLEEAEAKLAKATRSDIVSDPIGYAESHGLSKEEMALIGQAFLYHFVPEKAPPDLRTKLLEAKILRNEREKEAKAAEEAKAGRAMQEQQTINQYAAQIQAAIPSLAGKHPESEAWFGGNLKNYHLSLMQTANNLASAALKAGKVADLRPEVVAAALESHLAARMAARDKARQGNTQQAPKGPAEMPSAETKTDSSPAPKGPLTAEERIKRAIERGFVTVPEQ